MKLIKKLIRAHQKFIGASYDNPERYTLAVRPYLDELAKTGGWTYCAVEKPSGYPRNLIVYRPDAPMADQVVTVWFDPFSQGLAGDYEVVAWMECPEQPDDPRTD